MSNTFEVALRCLTPLAGGAFLLTVLTTSGDTPSHWYLALVGGGIAIVIRGALLLFNWRGARDILQAREARNRIASLMPKETRFGGGVTLVIGAGWIGIGISQVPW